jgi:hypothetical protein
VRQVILVEKASKQLTGEKYCHTSSIKGATEATYVSQGYLSMLPLQKPHLLIIAKSIMAKAAWVSKLFKHAVLPSPPDLIPLDLA